MLCVHAGAKIVDLATLRSVPLPEETRSYMPVGHYEVIEMVRDHVSQSFTIAKEQYAMSVQTKGVTLGHKMFGFMELAHSASDYTTTLGIRNSYDKSMPFGITVGSRVFVCDNMAFIGDYFQFRRHTRYVWQDLPEKLCKVMGDIPALIAAQDEAFARYKEIEFKPMQAHDFVVRAALEGVVTSDKILKVLEEYKEPSHKEFAEPSLWALLNAFTETMKGSNVFALADRTQALYKLADSF